MIFLDESGFMLQPLVRRTWAPRGETPVLYSWDRRNKWSAIGALVMWPERERKVEWVFHLQERNVRGEDVAQFVEQVVQHVNRPVMVIWDRYSVHKKAERLLREGGVEGIEIEYLPAYAPDLNPVEYVWGHTKYGELANFIPKDLEDLQQHIEDSFNRVNNRSELLLAFFHHAGLTSQDTTVAL